ncbi:mucin-2-like [Elgaria multicarinata webbii]|uniref:mucin-2-like n=1 Tax=Elgaria multicarinata webbii TaxID=159646 RepID=UPI002FCD0A9D
MSGSAVKCVTTPCVTSCPDAKVVIHPPPLVLTLPGLSLTTSPSQCLVETKTLCLTNGSEACGDGSSTAVVTRSSGLRAISGGDTPCCTTTCPDSQLVIQPPPVCITIPGAILTSYPNECLIETSTPCVPSGAQPRAITRSASVSNCSPTPGHVSSSTSVSCGLNSASPECVTRGPSSKVVIHPPPIEVTIPGPVLEIAAEECAVEVYNPCDNTNAITSGERCAITSGDEGEVKALTARTCTSVCGVIGASTCISQGPEMKIMIQPPPIEVDLPGPILQVFPEACKVETLSPCVPTAQELCSSDPQALCSSDDTTSTALAKRDTSLCTIKRPLPDIRRPPRPWAEMYSRSMTPRNIMAKTSQLTKYSSFTSASYQPSY